MLFLAGKKLAQELLVIKAENYANKTACLKAMPTHLEDD
jgi:hypothetical protein